MILNKFFVYLTTQERKYWWLYCKSVFCLLRNNQIFFCPIPIFFNCFNKSFVQLTKQEKNMIFVGQKKLLTGKQPNLFLNPFSQCQFNYNPSFSFFISESEFWFCELFETKEWIRTWRLLVVNCTRCMNHWRLN